MTEHVAIKSNIVVRSIEAVIFNVRWMLPAFYMGLTIVLMMYLYVFAEDIYKLALHFREFTMAEIEIIVLDMIDVVMIANLITMISSGSQHSFVSKNHGYSNVALSSGMLKIKIATSVLVVAMMHLLKNFVATDKVDWDIIEKELLIFGAFLAGAMVLGWLEHLHVKQEVMEHDVKSSH